MTSGESTSISCVVGGTVDCLDLVGEDAPEGVVEEVETSTGTKAMAPLLACF